MTFAVKMTTTTILIGSFLVAYLPMICGHDLKGFDDTILFNLDWPGRKGDLMTEESLVEEPLIVTTHNKEKYKCFIPSLSEVPNEPLAPYTGPGPLDLISTLFTSSSCSYRIESYWTYELCHGNYIKQFHEEREGKTSKKQEYFLGKWDKQKTDKLRETLNQAERDGEKLKYKKIDGLSLPYLEFEMSDGTLCDLIDNEPRVTKVLYVCYTLGKNEIYSLKEVSTCNYEVIILTPELCTHPSYKPTVTAENNINCVPLDESPDTPKSLVAMELESLRTQYQKLSEVSKGIKKIAIYKIDPKDGTLRMEMLQGDKFPSEITQSTLEEFLSKEPKFSKLTTKIHDTTPVQEFLSGKNCLTGGTGWWKYEFCYGRYVRQFHIDKSGETSIMLGFFDEALHKKWLDDPKNESKRPKPTRTHLSHFYQGGNICEKTGEKRQTEVKLKCMDGASSPTAVSLYLMEPQTCQYVLGVESPLICDILQKADEYGLMPKQEGEYVSDASTGEGVYLGNAVVEDVEVRFEND